MCISPMHMIILKTIHQDICIIILHIVFDTVVPRFLKMQYAPLLEALLLAHRSICRITFNLFSPTPAVIQYFYLFALINNTLAEIAISF